MNFVVDPLYVIIIIIIRLYSNKNYVYGGIIIILIRPLTIATVAAFLLYD